jgi:hypothetical protein
MARVKFTDCLRKAIKETSQAGAEMRGLKVVEFKLVKSKDVKNDYGLEGQEYMFIVMCERQARKYEDNKVFFEVYTNTINGDMIAYYDGSQEYYEKHFKDKVEA